ncbi:MAG: RNA polymerase sigma-70 factor [Niabella sp.]
MLLPDVSQLCAQVADASDERAFARLFEHFSPGMLHFANGIVRDPSAAEEIVSDVFVSVWKNRDMLHTIRSLPYYLYTSTKNRAINYLEARKKQRHIKTYDIQAEEISFSYVTPETHCIDADNLKRLIKAIAALPYQCQLIFKLSKEERLTHKEIAQLLNISTKTVENQITIAMRKLFETLKAVVPELSRYRKTGK